MHELQIRICHRLNVLYCEFNHGVGALFALVASALSSELGQSEGRLAGIADLATVLLSVLAIGEVAPSKVKDVLSLDPDHSLPLIELPLNHVEIELENGLCRLIVQLRVIE